LCDLEKCSVRLVDILLTVLINCPSAVVLGNPGSGCSTLLKILANQRGGYHAVEGEVHYDSFSPDEISKHYRGDVVYCSEDDVHFPSLTVDDTLQFAAKMRVPRNRPQGVTRTDLEKSTVDMLETMFGLRHVKDTFVGNTAIRGVSGGEKKRVTICEALASRMLVGAWDEYVTSIEAGATCSPPTFFQFYARARCVVSIGVRASAATCYRCRRTVDDSIDIPSRRTAL